MHTNARHREFADRRALVRAVLLLLMLWGGGCSGAIDNQSRTQQGGPIGVAGSGIAPGVGGAAAPPPSMNTQQQDDAMRAQNPQLFDLAAMYFPGQSAAGGKPRLFRLTRTQLDRTTQTLLPKSYMTTAEATLPRDPLQTNYEYADNLSWNPANFVPYTGWIGAIAAKVRTDPKQVVDCSAQSDAPACLDMQARRFVTRAFRGVTTEAQLARYSRFFTDSVMAVGMPGAAADLVEVTLSSPSYVFREEVQTDARRVLLPAQLLQVLSYTLADAPPEALGLASADAAMLVGTADAQRRTVETLLATPQARDKLLRFFMAWLEVKEVADFTISTNVFPEWTPAVAQAVVDETRKFLQQQLMGAAPALKDIAQSKKAFVSQASAFIYGSDARASGMLVDVDPAERVGIFTQPAVIASHSGPTNTRLVKRGVFFTRKVMCLPLGAPPPGIDTTVPMTAGMTERQRIDGITGKQPCLGCHAFINPFGFMQESYDAIGRFRTRDEGLPVDSSISVGFLEEGPLMTKTSVEALTAFTGSSRFKQCFTRQLFRFYLGRDELPTDDPLLRQLFFTFASADKQDIVGMLRQLAGAEAFAQRTEVP